jgi:hypothetical protein
MKAYIILCAIACAAAAFAPMTVSAHRIVCSESVEHELFRDGDVQVEYDDGSLIYTHKDDDETVEITSECKLIVNGHCVRLDHRQRQLVRDYYRCFGSIVEEAKEIGIEGAKIGAKGAMLGLAAVIGTLKLLAPDYDSDDLEEELDHKSEKIERVTARLEKKAEKLERRAKTFEHQHKQLRHEIEELNDLGWF